MIKVNLLPSYIAEFRRMKILAVVFAVLFIIEGGLAMGWSNGRKAQTEWMNTDKARLDAMAGQYKSYQGDADKLKSNSEAYSSYIKFFYGLGPMKDYNAEMVDKTFTEAAQKIGGDGTAYHDFTVKATGDLEATGRMKGSLQFLNYYFRMKDQSFTLDPAVQVGPLTQTVKLHVVGKVSPLPTPPSVPGTNNTWDALFKSVSGAVAGGAGAAPGAPGAPGGAMMPGGAGGAMPPGAPGGAMPPGAPGGAMPPGAPGAAGGRTTP